MPAARPGGNRANEGPANTQAVISPEAWGSMRNKSTDPEAICGKAGEGGWGWPGAPFGYG